MRIGILSDTHLWRADEELPAEIFDVFAGVDLIMHAGDIAHPAVLDRLERIAPVRAALGNNDRMPESDRLRAVQVIELEGWRLGMVHDLEPEDRPIPNLLRWHFNSDAVDIIVSGHTHYERIDYRDGVLQINPGSPTLPHNYTARLGTVAFLDLAPGRLDARAVRLGESPGLRNPGVEYSFGSPEGIVRARPFA